MKMKCDIMTRTPFPTCENYVKQNWKTCELCQHNLYSTIGREEEAKKDHFIKVSKLSK